MIPMNGRRAITLRRRDGALAWDTNGDPVKSTPVDTPITGSVQPVGRDDVQQLPEGYRRDKWRKVFTDVLLHTLDQEGSIQADQLVIDGEVYTVMLVDDWSQFLLPHYESLVVREKE